ncbi:BRO-N domain-containing protein [Proteus mirabilis]|uniref:BRO-N domain-containing protein n=1 Tax=Proteus mirabilis TaxID=584 RepID=UPI003C6E4752
MTTLSFAGSELDVFIGHKDFELLFIAKQVADCAGLKNPSHAISAFLKKDLNKKAIKVNELNKGLSLNDRLSLQPSTWMINESTAYRLLLQGHAPQSEPFRKWVTEEVLPSIRKTGSYDLAKSETSNL